MALADRRVQVGVQALSLDGMRRHLRGSGSSWQVEAVAVVAFIRAGQEEVGLLLLPVNARAPFLLWARFIPMALLGAAVEVEVGQLGHAAAVLAQPLAQVWVGHHAPQESHWGP